MQPSLRFGTTFTIRSTLPNLTAQTIAQTLRQKLDQVQVPSTLQQQGDAVILTTPTPVRQGQLTEQEGEAVINTIAALRPLPYIQQTPDGMALTAK